MSTILMTNESVAPATPAVNEIEGYPLAGVFSTKDSAGVVRVMVGPNEVTDTLIGDRTINDSTTPTDDTDSLTQLLSMIANRLRNITGEANWYDNADTNLTTIKNALTYNPQGSIMDVYSSVVLSPSSESDTVVIETNEYASAPQVWVSVEGEDAPTPIVLRVINREVDEVEVRWYCTTGVTPGQFTIRLFAVGVLA